MNAKQWSACNSPVQMLRALRNAGFFTGDQQMGRQSLLFYCAALSLVRGPACARADRHVKATSLWADSASSL